MTGQGSQCRRRSESPGLGRSLAAVRIGNTGDQRGAETAGVEREGDLLGISGVVGASCCQRTTAVVALLLYLLRLCGQLKQRFEASRLVLYSSQAGALFPHLRPSGKLSARIHSRVYNSLTITPLRNRENHVFLLRRFLSV